MKMVLKEKDESETMSLREFRKYKTIGGVFVLILVISLLALVASSFPDGLSYVSENVYNLEGWSFKLGIMDDYDFLGLGGILGTLLSAIIGAILVSVLFFIPYGLYRLRRSKTSV